MEKIAIRLEEKKGFARISEPVRLGIPLPKGAVENTDCLVLMDTLNAISVQFAPLTRWPDGSIRWIQACFLVSSAPNSKKELTLTELPTPPPTDSKPAFNSKPDSLLIDTAVGSVKLQSKSPSWLVHNCNNPCSIPSTVTLSDETGIACIAKTESDWEVTQNGSVFVAANIKGQWIRQNSDPLARFECELTIFLETGLIQVDITTHNPKRARHAGGLWDLGDPSSVYFRELAVETTLPNASMARVTPQATDKAPESFQLTDFNLYQDSSGGANWQSRNHIDSKGEITTQFCGYRLSKLNEVLVAGERANPLVGVEQENLYLEMAIPGFWENFPTSIRKEGNTLTIGLFPRDAKNAYELQGGEQKSLRCLMAYCSNSSTAATAYSALVPVIDPKRYEQAEAFPWFKANAQPEALDELITKGINGSSNFFAKREVIDEFGWRNFGDIFADHETLYQTEGAPPFISHYNNQYDPIFGFARQFALTGERRWFKLMDDLARHVVDIDIYHTNEDRAEYNNGLFWHTDHYLDAHTATHRTFSRFNDSSSTPGQTGGGPAEEHCYSTGLLYHHYLTGNEKSRQAVFELARWMTALHEGQGGFLEQILALKKREVPALKKMIRGETVSTHRYGFNRGTGNYLNTLLDAWVLDEKELWLRQAEAVIRKTIHPLDVIENRDLLDVENRWSYLVLLAALFRYLYLKRQINSYDEQYDYTKESVLRYTQWMLSNERPFMEDKSQLEFPNDTWVAQDVRKAMLMFQASELDHENAYQYSQLGQRWLEEFTGTLKHSNERYFSRILIILMQNYGPHILANPAPLNHGLSKELRHQWAPPVLTWRLLLLRICRRVLRAVINFRPSREKHWLNTRLDRQ